MKYQKYDHDIPEGHVFAETRNNKPKDQLLREHGFRLHSRPEKGEPVWQRGSVLMIQSKALEIIGSECMGK